MLFETWSAWENLIFGLPEGDIDKQRVRKVLEILEMTRTLRLVEDLVGAPPLRRWLLVAAAL
eukprot:14096575-Alexandrium_andersonii.AAC.1